jgi:hypothetical protein
MSFSFNINESDIVIKVRHAFSEDGVYEFSNTGRIVDFTVPTSGTYKIEAWGARGADGNSTKTGPLGAYSKSYVLLNKDEKIQILVGEKGYPGYSGYNHCGGGGGGTFIAKGNTPLCVAGGGGAFSDSTDFTVQPHACGQATQLSANFGTATASLKMGGKGGDYAAGGGGFVGNGDDGIGSSNPGKGGISFLNGGTRQTQGTYRSSAYGGFGGGASRNGACGRGAGGGGFTGGSASNSSTVQGGGGGSYFEGSYGKDSSLAISGCESRIPQNQGTDGNGFAILTLLNSPTNDVQEKKLSCYCHCYHIQFLWTLYSTLISQ